MVFDGTVLTYRKYVPWRRAFMAFGDSWRSRAGRPLGHSFLKSGRRTQLHRQILPRNNSVDGFTQPVPSLIHLRKKAASLAFWLTAIVRESCSRIDQQWTTAYLRSLVPAPPSCYLSDCEVRGQRKKIERFVHWPQRCVHDLWQSL
jgi:hypothetical protein